MYPRTIPQKQATQSGDTLRGLRTHCSETIGDPQVEITGSSTDTSLEVFSRGTPRRTLPSSTSAIQGLCDGPWVHQADPSHQTGTTTAAPDPEAVLTASNPLSLPGNGGQGQEIRAFRGRLKDVLTRTGGIGVSSRKEETRGRPDDVSGTNDSTETSRTLEALPEESEARAVPSDNSSHAYRKAWPPQVRE
ncbi:hypothetical protein NDU88_004522 [Pleurodeles waltl]|uniref:Uncharacterized protein n=1 Tax=Pleurodeles waltl TaxID=8319 RepID=A0AAV7T8C2_PLEWA|nr:hypothetical protein NDU88_004522 [Pleurodeles waltl]